MDAAVIAGAVRMGSRRAEDVIDAALIRAERASHLGAFKLLHREHALRRARSIDAQIAAGVDPGRLAGVPIAIKDNIAHAGMPLEADSFMLRGCIAPKTATALARLEREGAVVIGRTRMDAFAMGSSGEFSSTGPTLNPLSSNHVPGGSSSGSAVAVAAGVVPIALGSDTGGSVRLPASYCGVVGLRPTFGRISRSGLVAHACSLDQIGPLARSVRDAAIATHIMSGRDSYDATTLSDAMTPMDASLQPDLRGRVIGLPSECWSVETPSHRAVRGALAALQAAGATLTTVQLPALRYAASAYLILSSAEAASNLSRYDGVRYGLRRIGEDLQSMYTQSRSEGFNSEVRRRILFGTMVLAEQGDSTLYRRAQRAQADIRRQVEHALQEVDALVTLTAPTPAFRLGERCDDPTLMHQTDSLTAPASLIGIPALSVPVGLVDGLPVGAQIMTAHGDEATALMLGMAITGR